MGLAIATLLILLFLVIADGFKPKRKPPKPEDELGKAVQKYINQVKK